jgi:hypothetical protein
MTDHEHSFERAGNGLATRAIRRFKRLIGPTLGMFGLDSEGRLLSPPVEADEGTAARVQEADEKDDQARLAIAEAEIATERREKRQEAPPVLPL